MLLVSDGRAVFKAAGDTFRSVTAGCRPVMAGEGTRAESEWQGITTRLSRRPTGEEGWHELESWRRGSPTLSRNKQCIYTRKPGLGWPPPPC